MDPISAVLIGLGTFAIAQDIDYKYRTAYGNRPVATAQAEPAYSYEPAYPAYVYAPAPPPPLAGAVAGGLIGAAVGGGPGAAVGAITGAMIGNAARVPPPVAVAPAYAEPATARAAPARSSQFTDQYMQRWQGFMEPVGRR